MSEQKIDEVGAGDELVFNALLQNPELVANVLTTRSGLFQQLFDPRRDIDEECGYVETVTEEMYRKMYDREMGLRVVNVYPEETWKVLPAIYEDPDANKSTPFEESLDAFGKQHQLFHYMQRVDELSGIGHYGVVLWGLDDGLPMWMPVEGSETWEESTGKPSVTKSPERHVIYIRVLDASLVKIAEYEKDVTKPRYSLPLFYNITLADPRNVNGGEYANPPEFTEQKVHWSRITHIADNRKTSEVQGSPRMQAVWNRLCDLRKVLGGSAEMFWQGGFPGISLETQPGLENAALDEDRTTKMMYNYRNKLQRHLALTGMTAKSLSPQIADPTASFTVHIKAICVTLGVPFRVFMGIEEGVVSGDQATQAWDGRLKNRQSRYVTPMIIDTILQRLIDYGVLQPTAEPRGWVVEWPDLTARTESDKAAVALQKTDAMAKYVAGGVDTLIPPIEYLTQVLGFDDDTAKAIIEAAIEHIEGIADENTAAPAHGLTPPELRQEGGVTTKKSSQQEEE